MPRKKNESSIKEVYRLWWEYLKLSRDYKSFCEWMDRRSKDPNLPIQRQGNWFELRDGYMFFGNIHVDSFEEWWKRKKNKLGKRNERGFPGPIEDYTEFVMSDVEDVVTEFKRKTGREPSMEEFKRSFLEHLKFPVSRFYFMVSLFGDYQLENLGKQFIKILKEKKKQHTEIAKKREEEYFRSLKKELPFPILEAKADKYATWAGRWQHTTTLSRLVEIERYLRVYSLFAQHLKWSQIAKEIDPNYKGDRFTLKRSIYNDKENAQKIIRNVEKGIFPGQY